jgi:N-acetylneuraminate synthase/N,N'-diacetyllegionaminate synthase
MRIGNFIVGEGAPCFIIAEIANNHDKRKEQAKELIHIAAKAGAQAVKFQTFSGLDIASAGQLSTDYNWPPAHKYKYWYQYLDTISLPFEWYPELVDLTRHLGMAFIGTPCSIERAHFLVEVGADALKIASMDNNNIPFLEAVGTLQLPVIISTGMAYDDEVEEALSVLGHPNKSNIALLHCISNYPTKPQDMRLGTIKRLQSKYPIPIGFSDHALHNYGSFAAVALGAKIIEKHVTISRKLEGPDHFFSLAPGELKDLIDGIREIELGLTECSIRPDENAQHSMYRSIHFAVNVTKGTVLTEKHLEIKRPAVGLEPRYFWDVVGKRAARNKKAFESVTWDVLEKDE